MTSVPPSSHSLTPPLAAVQQLWAEVGLPPDALPPLVLTGAEPALPSAFACGTAAQSLLAACGAAAAALHARATGRHQTVSVDMRHAVAEFRSERLLRIDDGPPPELWDPLAGAYRTADGWVRVHTNFAHHRDALTRLLDCPPERSAVAAAIARWSAGALERAGADGGAIIAALRTLPAWDGHPQGQAVAREPLIALERIGDAPPVPLPMGQSREGLYQLAGLRPLAGLRVLDLTRIIAGPVAGRVLAAHGAEVLRLIAPNLPTLPALDLDTGRGKRSAHLNLRSADGARTLRNLVRGADVLVQAYRPGALAGLGFAATDTAALRPGLIHVSLAAYGHSGPWANRRGFDSIVQTASGLNAAEAEAAGQDSPRALPAQVLDHGAGCLMALGTLAALWRRAREGGSWHVRVSLARTALWLRSLGTVPEGPAAPDLQAGDVADLMETTHGPAGRITAVRPAAILSDTPAVLGPPSLFGHHPPVWLGAAGTEPVLPS